MVVIKIYILDAKGSCKTSCQRKRGQSKVMTVVSGYGTETDTIDCTS